MITMANKVVLTSYQFPSYQAVALGQIGTAIVVLFLGRELDLIDFPVLERGTIRRVCMFHDKLLKLTGFEGDLMIFVNFSDISTSSTFHGKCIFWAWWHQSSIPTHVNSSPQVFYTFYCNC